MMLISLATDFRDFYFYFYFFLFTLSSFHSSSTINNSLHFLIILPITSFPSGILLSYLCSPLAFSLSPCVN